MYVHLGRDTTVTDRSLVGIFDLDTSTVSRHTVNFLKQAEQKNLVVMVADDLPKSFVICDENKKKAVYVTQIAAQTIEKRLRGNF